MRSIKTLILILSCLLFYNANAQCPPPAGPQDGDYGHGGDNSIFDNFFDWIVRIIGSGDPNEIVGTAGYNVKKWVSVNDRLGYTVRFENDPKIATSPAQNVFVRLPVDAKININSLQLGDIGFGKFRFSIPHGSSYYATRLDVRDSLCLFVDLTAGIDVVNNELFWRFRSIDPATGLPPMDAQSGFLPVNDTATDKNDTIPGKGEGFVSFTIKPVNTAQTGDTAFEKASIVFDINEPIPTNSWTNTIDAEAPVSRVNGTAVYKDTIVLHWSGADDVNGSGIKDYSLYYAENSNIYTAYRQNITDTTLKFVGTPGKTYCFFTIASDHTGNKEKLKATCEATAIIPISAAVLPITWLYFNGQERGKDAFLNWATTSEINTKLFVIERSSDGFSFTQIGTVKAAGNSSLTTNYNYTDIYAMALPYNTLYYRLRQVDNDAKSNYSIIISISLRHNNSEPIVTAYPNPFDQFITLKILTVTPTDQTDNVALYSIDGRVLYQKAIVMRGSSTILLDGLPMLPSGIYMLHTRINGKEYTIKLTRK